MLSPSLSLCLSLCFSSSVRSDYIVYIVVYVVGTKLARKIEFSFVVFLFQVWSAVEFELRLD